MVLGLSDRGSSWEYEVGHIGAGVFWFELTSRKPKYWPWARSERAQSIDREAPRPEDRLSVVIVAEDDAAAMRRYTPVK